MQNPTESGTALLDAPLGPMEVVFDVPKQSPRGLAVVAHPQPLLGGSALHKVPHVLARAVCEQGWLVARPNFRGVGRSAGSHDHGLGETDDLLWLCDHLLQAHVGLPLALVGFSFGAFVQARVARALADRGTPAAKVCLAGVPFGEVQGQRRYDTPDGLPDALVIHGEHDERVALQAVFDWARPQVQPVVVVPGADHFFTGRLPLLRSLVVAHLNA
jgi:alpha/beta superfamily hydrolase